MRWAVSGRASERMTEGKIEDGGCRGTERGGGEMGGATSGRWSERVKKE